MMCVCMCVAALDGSEGRKRVNRGDRARVIGIRWVGGGVGLRMGLGPNGLGLQALSRFQRNRSLEEMLREVGVEFGHEVNFLRPTKMSWIPEK